MYAGTYKIPVKKKSSSKTGPVIDRSLRSSSGSSIRSPSSSREDIWEGIGVHLPVTGRSWALVAFSGVSYF